jgi:uncharacterized membrane protein
MTTLSKLRLLGATALSLAVLNGLGVDFRAGRPEQGWMNGSDRAEARSSGGRSRGGSFGGSSGGGSRSAPSYRNPGYGGSGYGGYNDPYYRQPSGGPVFVPVPGGGYGYGYSPYGSGFGLTLLPLLLGGGILLIAWIYFTQRTRRLSNAASNYGAGEIDNNIVTVTRLQVALLAEARYIQDELTQLVQTVDPETPEGLTEMLRETVLALLRSPENWTHVRSSSQTLKSREEAARIFEQMSIEERSKFSAETLARVGGQIRRQTLRVPNDEDPASYIVVTLLVGSADDRPLIDSTIYSAEDLQKILQRLGGISPEYLLVFELLWSPQDATDSLTRDELLTEYSDLIQIA